MDETRHKNKKLRRRMDNAQSAVRAEAATGAYWVCWGWLKGQGEYCNARNLMVRETCYVCSYRIKPWDWYEAARKQEFEWEKHSRAQFAMLNKNQHLRGSRGGREKRSKKKLMKTRRTRS